MAMKGGVLDIQRGAVRGPVDITGTLAAVDDAGVALDSAYDGISTNLQARVAASQPAASTAAPEWGEAEFGMNSATGEIQLPDGTVVKGDAPTIMQLATLKSKDGEPLPKLQRLSKGMRPITQAEMKSIVDSIPPESDFWGEFMAAGKGTLGLMASAIDSMFGNDRPGNSWSDSQANLPKSQSIGQIKAGEARWYSGSDALWSALGETSGNIAGTIAGALPVAAATAAAGAATGAGVGAIPGGVLGAGLAVSGGAAAYGEQASEFYDTALATMQKMSPETLEAESPLYREILREQPGITYEEAIKEVAVRGSRAAGTTAGALGAVEGMVGGRLASNFLGRMRVSKYLLGEPMEGVSKAAGIGRTAARVAGRTAAGGVAAGAEEMGESMLGQAAGAATTGVGSTNPMDYANIEEGISASLGGGIFGALGGRSRTPQQVVAESDIGAALGAGSTVATESPDGSTPWKQGQGLTEEQDQIPAAMRRTVVPSPGPIEGLAGPAEVPPEQREQVAMQIANVLADRYGAQWPQKLEQISQEPEGKQLLGQLVAIQRAVQAEGMQGQEQPAYQRGYGQGPVDEGQAPAQGVLPLGGGPRITQDPAAPPAAVDEPGVDPAQDMLPLTNDSEVPASEDDGSRVPLNLLERRKAQELRQQEAAESSAADPAALPGPASAEIEDQIFTVEDDIAQLEQSIADRPARDPRKAFLKKALANAKAQLKGLEKQWMDAKQNEPTGVMPGSKVDAPEPVGASAERTPDGRPLGVTPAPIANPEPMSPEEAASRQQTQQERRGAPKALTAGARKYAAASRGGVPADYVEQAAASTEQQVSPSTPEPAADIKGQMADLSDPQSSRDAVFVAADPVSRKQTFSPKVPKGVLIARREGEGVLYTTNPQKAARFSDLSKKLTDKDLAQMLGYSQSKGDALRRGKGKAPVVVQAKKGDAVVADQIAAPADVPAAKKSLKKLAPKAQIVTTTPEKAQARRSLKREAPTPAKKSLKKPKADEEKTPAQVEAGNYQKRHERVDGLEFAVETEAGQKRKPEWPALKHAYGYIKKTLGKDGDHVDAFFGPEDFNAEGPVFVIDQQSRDGKFDEHKVMLGFKDEAAAREGYLSNYAKGWNGLGAITEMSWPDFKAWVRDQTATQKRAERSAGKVETRADRALAAAPTAQAPAAPADAVEKAATRKAATVTSKGKAVTLPEKMTKRTGAKGAAVDMRVEAIDEDARYAVGRLLDGGSMRREDREVAEAALRDFDQLDTLLDAAVSAAEDRLQKTLDDAPDGKALMAKHAEESKGTKNSPIATIPLVISEIRGFLQAVRAEAKAEMDTYQPANSVARQLVAAFLPNSQNAMQFEREGKRILRTIANLDDATLESLLRNTHDKLADSTVAKQVMRGATEVAHAIRRADQNTAGASNVEAYDHQAALEAFSKKALPFVSESTELPASVKGVVNGWVQQFEKGGNKFSGTIYVMSLDEARSLYPDAFKPNDRANAKFIVYNNPDKPGAKEYAIAVDWSKFAYEGQAVEALAHEFGHMVTIEAYNRADPKTRRAVTDAYNRWLQSTRGKSAMDVLRSQMPGFDRIFSSNPSKDFSTSMEYATDFWEWSARNAALYVLDPARPHLGVVEKFFKTVADAMRRVYRTFIGELQPDGVWAETLDRWISGVAKVTTMPSMEEVSYDHEAFNGPTEETSSLRSKGMLAQATAGLEGLKTVLGGSASVADVEKVMGPILKSQAVDLTKQLGLSLMTMRQIERQYRDTPLGPALTGWVRNQQQKAQTANRALESGSQWMERANQLDAKVRTALEIIMYEATHFGIHPDLPLEHKDNAHLLKGSDYVKGVNAKRYMGLRNKWQAATRTDANVVEIYRGLRDAFTKLHIDTLDKQIELIENANFSKGVKVQIVARMKQAQLQHKEGPYFPLMRFGNWIVKVQLPAFFVGKGSKEGGASFKTKAEAREEMRNQRALNPGSKVSVEAMQGEDGYVVRVYQSGVYFFESAAQAEAATAEIEREVRENYDAAGVDYDAALAGMEATDPDEAGVANLIIHPPKGARDGYEQLKSGSPEFLNEVRALVRDGKMDSEVANTLERLAIESLPENSYRKSMLPRQNVFGASKQMLRAYAHRFQGAAHHYSTVEHGAAINKNWSRAWEVSATYQPAARVLNMLGANQKAVADRTKSSTSNTIMNAVTDASSLFSLGFSPAYVLTNALQPSMVTLPVLAGMNGADGKSIGMVKAGKYLKDAYAGAAPFFTKRGIQDFVNETKGLIGKRGDDHTLQDGAKEIITKFGQTDAERTMLESLLERGTLDFSWLNSLEDAMRGGKIGAKWANLQRLGMALPQQVEAMNRVTTALAAYRLAKDEGMFADETSLQQFADDTVADTQLDYSRMNRPLLFNKAGLNVILQFKLYMQGMYMLFARNAALAIAKPLPGESAADHKARRAQGRKTIGYLLASHAAGAGTLGLGPAAWMAKMALVAFAAMNGDDDDDWKTGEQLHKEMMTDLFGEYGGQVVQHGLPAILGLDMSDRIGLPVLYDSRFAGNKETDSAATGMDKFVLYSLGAPYSNARRVWQGVSDAKDGEWAKSLNGLPSGARALARSGKWLGEGILEQDGDVFIKREDLSWSDLSINALGLSPLKVSTAYQQRSEQKMTMASIQAERKRLLQEARTGEDVDGDINKFNMSVPKPFRITSAQIKSSKDGKAKRERGELRKDEKAIADYLK